MNNPSETRPTKIGVLIAIPVRYWRGPDQFHPGLRALLNELGRLSLDETCPYEFTWAVCSGGLVRARNRMIPEARKAGVRWVVWLDDDIAATAANILTLLGHRKPIVAGLYCVRDIKPQWVCNFLHEVELQPGNLLQVFEVGLGLKAYHMQVFDELDRLYPAIAYSDRDTGEKGRGYFQHCVIDGDLLPEDYFCDYLCRRVKIAIWVDVSLKLRHRGPDGTMYPVNDEWPPIPGIE